MIKSLHPQSQRSNRRMSESQKEDLIRQYLPLVRKTMRQFLRKVEQGSDKIEIFENGVLGLVQALETYSYEDNLSFPQYAERFIQEYISQGLKALHSCPVDLLPFTQIEEDFTDGVENEIEEERRLFYVGCTRSIDRLFLLYKRDVKVSRFIMEMPKFK